MSSQVCLHASAVAVDNRGLLILGPSGSGKSSLALQLMANGATLVADDRTDVTVRADQVWLSAPDAISGLIEARGVGLLTATPTQAPLFLVVDLGVPETQRLPKRHDKNVLGHVFPCLHKMDTPAFPAAIMQYLKAGRRDPG
ncbi:MAG: HPr kinase/phosphorylase [Tateyamaria sp.]